MAFWYQKLTWGILRKILVSKLKKKWQLECVSGLDEPQGPYVLLPNHAFLPDPFIVGTFLKSEINYMANISGADFKMKLGSYIMGAFDKRKGEPDMKALKKTFDLTRAGHTVGIFPEGDRSWDGRTREIPLNVIKLVKKLRLPIYLARLEGHYLCGPRWAECKRESGKVFLHYKSISLEEINKISLQELHQQISQFLHNDELKNQKLRNYHYPTEDRAKGIRFLLWLCPECESHDGLYGKDNHVFCRNCQASWELSEHLQIVPENKTGKDIADWADWQLEKIGQIVQQNKSRDDKLTMSHDIDLYLRKDKDEEFLGQGDLVLYHDRMELEGEKLFSFKIDEIMYYVDNFNKSFWFYYDAKRYTLYFKGKNAYKWICFLKQIQKDRE